MPQALAQRDHIYAEVADVLIQYEALQNRPLGGSYALPIYREGFQRTRPNACYRC